MSTDLELAPVVDVRPLLSRERDDLLTLLGSLSPTEWDEQTSAEGWTVRDLAMHLLDDDFGWLSRGRDGDSSGRLDPTGKYRDLVRALAEKNQRFVDGVGGLSPRVLCDLLVWAGEEMDEYYASLDLHAHGSVIWASDGPVPLWFDMAQDLTERWVHQHQIREALNRVEDFEASYLSTVLRTFVWALPHQYRGQAPTDTTVDVDLAAGGLWHLKATSIGRWVLCEGLSPSPTATVRFSGGAAWRWLTGAAFDQDEVSLVGPQHLIDPLMAVRGIIV